MNSQLHQLRGMLESSHDDSEAFDIPATVFQSTDGKLELIMLPKIISKCSFQWQIILRRVRLQRFYRNYGNW